METLKNVEAICHASYVGTDAKARAEAQQEIIRLQSTADFIPQCQFILDNSQQPMAHFMASLSLEVLLTQFWNNFTVVQKLEMRNYVLNYLATNASVLEDYLVQSLTKLVCRITKLGWFDDEKFREIIEEVSKFIAQPSIEHQVIGLRILNSLVEEMNLPTSGRTLTVHRKTAVSFRDAALLQVFTVAITTLKHVHASGLASIAPGEPEGPQHRISQLALALATASLSFDFIGTNPEESAEDVGTVQVPSTWRPMIQDTSTMQLLFDFYAATEPPRSDKALECLVQLSSVRRSLFSGDRERTEFLQCLMSNLQNILKSCFGLGSTENYHQFCRLLGRLKASYQLSELVKTTGFAEFLELSRDFTLNSLESWESAMNSVHYLLALWGRLVAALPYLKDEQSTQREAGILKRCVLDVVGGYIRTMLTTVEAVVMYDKDDPLEDESSLREQMERLPVIARLQYEQVAENIVQMFTQLLEMYSQMLQHPRSPELAQQILVVEGKMTWLTHMIGAVIGSQSPSDPRRTSVELEWDGQLSVCVFKLVNIIDFQLGQTGGEGKCDAKLEVAILSYFKSFKKAYMMDSGCLGSSIPGGSPAHPLLALALSYGSGTRSDDSRDGHSEAASIFDSMKIGNLNEVMGIVVNKVCNNIKFWHKTDMILESTLEVFVELVSSYSSSKTLLKLDTVNFLVSNHTGENFPFLGYDSDNKFRITFYSAMSRLVFSAAEDLANNFDVYIQPQLQVIAQLNGMDSLESPEAKVAIMGILRDLRGIAEAATNKRTYNMLFEALHPSLFIMCKRVAETWHTEPTVMTALLKFIQEFVHNKSQRIVFDQSSANGILLFRETSQIVCTYGSRILELPVQRDLYTEKYKGIRLMLNVLTCALSGDYVNFGVFALYQDPALSESLKVSLGICMNIPIQDVLTYPKLSKAYFSFLEILFRNHLDVLSELDTDVFISLLSASHEGLQSSDIAVSALCASAVDHLATYMFLNMRREGKPTVQRIRVHMEAAPDILHHLMSTLFNSLLFTSHANHWAVTRPILSLLLASNNSFKAYQEHLMTTQGPENQARLVEEFKKLEQDIQPSVETSNRDRFTQKLTMFRLNVRAFLAF